MLTCITWQTLNRSSSPPPTLFTEQVVFAPFEKRKILFLLLRCFMNFHVFFFIFVKSLTLNIFMLV